MEIGSAGERGRRRWGGLAGLGPADRFGAGGGLVLPRAPLPGQSGGSPGSRPGGAACAGGSGGEAVRVGLAGQAGGRGSAPPAGREEPLQCVSGNRGKLGTAACAAAGSLCQKR